MQVDTGQFQALTAQVGELTEAVRKLGAREAILEAAFEAGYSAGAAHVRGELYGRAARTTTARRPRRLRAVDGGAS